ncbi:MAG: dGTP triphosphohydrolase [Verrucomicrobiota bacterium]
MTNRFYEEHDFERPRGTTRGGDYRTPFQIDRDRLIHNAAFRRLQSKTQVFFSGEYDFYRTRLTHSIEVAQIGRGICQRLLALSPLLSDDFFIDPDLVEAACLAHDIGHPPYGHTGESTLHRLMKPYGGFEGNAQTLRLIGKSFYGPRRGMNPCRALVDGVLKYKTLYQLLDDPPNHFIYDDQSEWLEFALYGQDFTAEFEPGKKRDKHRSIECQIMDWADDTAYSLHDISDGIHAGFLTTDKIERWASQQELDSEQSSTVDALIQAIKESDIERLIGAKIGLFIAAAQLVESERFLSDQTNRHRYDIQIDPTVEKECKVYKQLSFDLVFRSQQLSQLDHKANYILTRLFDVLSQHYIQPDERQRGHFQILSQEDEKLVWEQDSESERARIVCDAMAKMTDGVASRMFKRLFEPDFGSIVDLV